jgi:hypothetical protein
MNTIKIKTVVPESVLTAYNNTLRECGEYCLYGIDRDMLGDCAQDILRDMALCSDNEVIVSTEYLKEEIRWNLTEKLVCLFTQAKENEEITPQNCAKKIRKLHKLNKAFEKLADESKSVEPWLVNEIEV